MKKLIHVIEDDEDIRFIVEYILVESGYEVETSGTVKEFGNKLSHHHPDLILLDVMLPDGNGIDLCRSLKTDETTAHLPVIVMSAHAAQKSILEEACANDFISKPFDLEDLIARIKRIFDGSKTHT